MAAVQQRKTGRTRLVAPKRKHLTNPLDTAKGYEVKWPQVASVFGIGQLIEGCTYVYFIGEENDGPVKIGFGKDPVARLRAMQTGNPRRLCVEHVLIGGRFIEKLMHEMWEEYAIVSALQRGKVDVPPGTEWFRPEIRERLFPVVATAAELQVAAIHESDEGSTIQLEDLESLIRQAHGQHDIVAKKRHETHLLGAGGGYVVRRRSRI